MNIDSTNLSFKSTIKFIDIKTFNSMVKPLCKKKHEVGYPWTPDVIKRGKNLFTTKIMDCIAGGIVDGRNVTMFHLCTRNQEQAKRTHQRGFDIRRIRQKIRDNIDLNSDTMQGFIIGGFQLKENDTYNANKLKKIIGIFNELKIPFTVFGARKDVHYFGRYSIFYSSKEDTWYVTNSLTGASNPNKECIIEIKDDKKIKFDTYKKNEPDKPVLYERTRHEGSTLDFFKSQYRIVSVSKLDYLI